MLKILHFYPIEGSKVQSKMRRIFHVVGLVFCLVGLALSAQALQFEKIQKIELDSDFFPKSTLGGLSGAFFKGNQLWAISDDRGRVDRPRIFIFDIELQNKKFILRPNRILYIEKENKNYYLDGEALVMFSEDRMIVSSEGDHNSKPRKMPKLFEIDLSGHVQKEIPLPKSYLPEISGLQKKGLQSNAGFESVALSDGKLYAAAERPLMQDKGEDLRWLQFSQQNNQWVVDREYSYPLTKEKTPGQITFQKGLSEILPLGPKKFLSLERSLQVSLRDKIHFDVHVFEVDLSPASKEASSLSPSGHGFDNEIKKSEIHMIQSEDQDNYEALAWGPMGVNGRKTLWMISDNNFKKNLSTKILIYEMKEE